MRNARETIPAHLGLLQRNSDAIAAAYAGLDIDEDAASGRDIIALTQANVLVENAEGSRRLSRSLQTHLDEVMRKRRSYRAGENFAGQVKTLENLIAAIEDAIRENRYDRQIRLEDDFRHAAESLAQGLDDTLSHLRTEVDNEFGDLPSFSEKSRQNEHYTRRVEETIHALALIGDSDIVDKFNAEPLLEMQERIHRTELLDQVPKWRQAFMTISEILGRHVHTLRRVDPEAKALRRLALHMDGDRSYEMPVDPNDAPIEAWMLHAEAMDIQHHPDVDDLSQDQMLGEIVAAMPHAIAPKKVKRTAGIVAEEDDEPTTFVIKRTPWRIAYDAMLVEARTRRVSAKDWYQSTSTGTSLDIWLIYVSSMTDGSKPSARLVVEPTIVPHDQKDGTLKMKDVALWTQA